MNIVANADSLLTPLTGIGQYTYQLLKELREIDGANRYTYYYGFFSDQIFSKSEHESVSAQTLEQSKIRAFQRLRRAIKKVPVVGTFGRELRTFYTNRMRWIKAPKFDLYFEPNSIPLGEIKSKHTATMVFDLSVLLYPQWHPEGRVRIFKEYFTKGIERSDVVLTSTDFIKRQLMEYLGISESKIRVTPISCNKKVFKVNTDCEINAVLARHSIPKNYILFVGSIEPRKNVLSLLNAYLLLPADLRNDIKIVFCGPAGWKNRPVFEFLEENRLMDRVHFTNYISDEELGALYNRAIALVYPSFYEGFGLPPLEAMASGCPVIASRIPPHQEVCGDAVYYIDPNSSEEAAEAIEKLLVDSEFWRELKNKGLEQAKKFSWHKTAQLTLNIFNSFELD